MRKRPKRSRALARPSCVLPLCAGTSSSISYRARRYQPRPTLATLLAFHTNRLFHPAIHLPSQVIFSTSIFRPKFNHLSVSIQRRGTILLLPPLPQSIPSKRSLLRCRRRALIDHSRLTPTFFPFPLVLQFASRTFITLVTSSTTLSHSSFTSEPHNNNKPPPQQKAVLDSSPQNNYQTLSFKHTHTFHYNGSYRS
jgi:hypothetical protein